MYYNDMQTSKANMLPFYASFMHITTLLRYCEKIYFIIVKGLTNPSYGFANTNKERKFLGAFSYNAVFIASIVDHNRPLLNFTSVFSRICSGLTQSFYLHHVTC